MDKRTRESTLSRLKYDIKRLQVKVMALEGKRDFPELEQETEMSETEVLLWLRAYQAKIEFNSKEVSVSLGSDNQHRIFKGKNLLDAVTDAKEFFEASNIVSPLSDSALQILTKSYRLG